MCGIAGFWSRSAVPDGLLGRIGNDMAAAIAHRGPDAQGVWFDAAAGLVLSHRRLSILDLSPAGAQPMHSACGRYVIVFNGEIYNHLELRESLAAAGAAPGWRGHSDTETLLAGFASWGIERTLEHAAGMFALAVWDNEARSLVLARDRMGEKPLYYGTSRNGFFFASELAAISRVPDVDLSLDPASLRSFLSHGAVEEPRSIFRGFRKLPPGTIARMIGPDMEPAVTAYWSLPSIVREKGPKRANVNVSTFDAETRNMERLLTQVVGSQMISDVPLGSFLSGGIDSSLVTALMQSQSDRPVRTFSVGFENAEFDESRHAERVARHLRTEHVTFLVREEDALALIPDLPRVYGEPFADSSQIPSLLLARKARRHVTVALTGDGGDEIFGGYNRHVFGPSLWRLAGRLPRPVRRLAEPVSSRIARLSAGKSRLVRGLLARTGWHASTLLKLARHGQVLARSASLAAVYEGLTHTFDDPDSILDPAWRAPGSHVERKMTGEGGLAPAEWMMIADSLRYLPNDILVKVDRASMSVGLETRAPFLDRRIVEAAWSLPLALKIDKGKGKRVLRDILARHVPRALFDRPKQGFAVPLDRWLRGELRPWAGSLLHRDRIREFGLLDAEAVATLWNEHSSGCADHGQKLWVLLTLQGWMEIHGDMFHRRRVALTA